MFWKRKKLSVADDFEARLNKIESEVSKIKREHIEINMDLDNFRDKVLRKIQNKRKDNKDDTTSTPLDGLPRLGE